MSISYRGGSTASNLAGGTVVVAKPVGVQNGDVMIATTASDSAPIEGTSGFTFLLADDTRKLSIKIANNAEPANYTFGQAGGTYCVVLIDAYSGVSQFDWPLSTISLGTINDINFPAITTQTDNAWHYISYVAPLGSPAPVAPTGYVLRNSNPNNIAGLDRIKSPAGLITGVTIIGGGNSPGNWTAFSTLLRQASGSLMPASTM